MSASEYLFAPAVGASPVDSGGVSHSQLVASGGMETPAVFNYASERLSSSMLRLYSAARLPSGMAYALNTATSSTLALAFKGIATAASATIPTVYNNSIQVALGAYAGSKLITAIPLSLLTPVTAYGSTVAGSGGYLLPQGTIINITPMASLIYPIVGTSGPNFVNLASTASALFTPITFNITQSGTAPYAVTAISAEGLPLTGRVAGYVPASNGQAVTNSVGTFTPPTSLGGWSCNSVTSYGTGGANDWNQTSSPQNGSATLPFVPGFIITNNANAAGGQPFSGFSFGWEIIIPTPASWPV